MRVFFHTAVLFLTGFFLYLAWTGFIEKELTVNTLSGEIMEKIREDSIAETGINVQEKAVYMVKLSTGKVFAVSSSVFERVEKGENVQFAEKDSHFYLIDGRKIIY